MAVLRGKGAIHNRRYRRGWTLWTIRPKEERPQTKGEAAVTETKWGVDRIPRPTTARASWISQETWRMVDRKAALQQAHRVSAWEVRQARQEFWR